MNRLSNQSALLTIVVAVIVVGLGLSLASTDNQKSAIPLKDAKLNIEHNATDSDTGFQGFVDSEGWSRLSFAGPEGRVLSIKGHGKLGNLGLTELFFETVEPKNAKISVTEMLKKLPEGNYIIEGPATEAGKKNGSTRGVAWLTHDIPAGPEILSPKEDAEVSTNNGLSFSWQPVDQTITGSKVNIIAYELIVQKDIEPHPHMIGKLGLDMYLPATVTSITIPGAFFEPGTSYKWEVLAIEESGNQTLSSSQFRTR